MIRFIQWINPQIDPVPPGVFILYIHQQGLYSDSETGC